MTDRWKQEIRRWLLCLQALIHSLLGQDAVRSASRHVAHECLAAQATGGRVRQDPKRTMGSAEPNIIRNHLPPSRLGVPKVDPSLSLLSGSVGGYRRACQLAVSPNGPDGSTTALSLRGSAKSSPSPRSHAIGGVLPPRTTLLLSSFLGSLSACRPGALTRDAALCGSSLSLRARAAMEGC